MTLTHKYMKTTEIFTGARVPYLAPSCRELPLTVESAILSGLEGEPINWDEELEL